MTRDLDQSVADAIGWKCARRFQLPDGNMDLCTRERGYLKHGAHTWARMQLGPEFRAQQFLPCDHFPHYSTDPGTALSLVAGEMAGMIQPYFELRTCGAYWTARLDKDSEDGATPSEAIARVVLARHKRGL